MGGSYTPSTRLIEINRPEQVDLQFSNGRAFTYSISNDVNRLTGYDAARVLVVGPGADGALTGAVTFNVPTGTAPSGAAWTINGGSTPVNFTTFTKPAEFVVQFNFVTGDFRRDRSNAEDSRAEGWCEHDPDWTPIDELLAATRTPGDPVRE